MNLSPKLSSSLHMKYYWKINQFYLGFQFIFTVCVQCAHALCFLSTYRALPIYPTTRKMTTNNLMSQVRLSKLPLCINWCVNICKGFCVVSSTHQQNTFHHKSRWVVGDVKKQRNYPWKALWWSQESFILQRLSCFVASIDRRQI